MDHKYFKSAQEAALNATPVDDRRINRSALRMLTQMTGKPVNVNDDPTAAVDEARQAPSLFGESPKSPDDIAARSSNLIDDLTGSASEEPADDSTFAGDFPADDAADLNGADDFFIGPTDPDSDLANVFPPASRDEEASSPSVYYAKSPHIDAGLADITQAAGTPDEGADSYLAERTGATEDAPFRNDMTSDDAPAGAPATAAASVPDEEQDGYLGERAGISEDASFDDDAASGDATVDAPGRTTPSGPDLIGDPAPTSPASVDVSLNTQLTAEAAEEQMNRVIGAIESLARAAATDVLDRHQQDTIMSSAMRRAALGQY